MKILAIDTSERQFSVAALIDDWVLQEFIWEPSSIDSLSESASDTASGTLPKGVAVELFPLLQRLLAHVNWKMVDIELIAVAKGPGSFTGLRTGIVAAKTLAFANKVSVQGANTLEASANQLGWHLGANRQPDPIGNSLAVHCAINAQRQQLFAAKYLLTIDPSGNIDVQLESTSRIFSRDAWVAELKEGDWVTGTGLKPLLGTLQNLPINVAPQNLWPSLASSIGRVAYHDFLSGKRDDFWTLEPLYFRPSYADENLVE